MITFKVDNVLPGNPESKYPVDSEENRKGLFGPGVEGTSPTEGITTVTGHNFVEAVNKAYDKHLNLTLSPDMMWLLIAQGLSQHINNNAEQLRHQFVSHEGKKKIEVFEDGFRKGAQNNWPHMFGQFSREIATYIGKKRDLIVNSFSTTGPVELAASEVVLMEAMQKYFSYECTTCCGIPNITLTGSKEDWRDIANRVRAISEFDLGWWTAKLGPIVDEFVSAANGTPNVSFWQNIYKVNGGSGGPYISGWITDLFPYLKDYSTKDYTQRNTFNHSRGMGGLTSRAFPTGMAKVPFIWNYFSEKFNMELAAGFVGNSYLDEAIVPQIGWAVRDTEAFVTINTSYTNDPSKSWDVSRKIRDGFVSQLNALGFEEQGWGQMGKITGLLPKAQVETAKEIAGLTFVEAEDGIDD